MCSFINNERDSSKTTLLQQWEKPKSSSDNLYSKGQTVGEMYHNKQTIHSARTENIFSKKELFNKVKDIDCALSRILREECENENSIISSWIVNQLINDAVEQSEKNTLIYFCRAIESQSTYKIYRCYSIVNLCDLKFRITLVNFEIMQNLSVQKFYNDRVKVSTSQKYHIAFDTRQQSGCQAWFQERKIRVSASQQAHKIKTLKDGDYDQLARSFLQNKEISSTAIRYGRNKEHVAVNEYCSYHKYSVIHPGVCIKEQQPWLCCSPDGIVLSPNEFVLLEIKCPFSCREKPIIQEDTINVHYLYKSCEGRLRLRESHIYYTQIQVSLYVLNMRSCDLYIYSPKGSLQISVPRDENFLSYTIPTLERFYFMHYLPLIYQQSTSAN